MPRGPPRRRKDVRPEGLDQDGEELAPGQRVKASQGLVEEEDPGVSIVLVGCEDCCQESPDKRA
jgi:hypothetical protein